MKLTRFMQKEFANQVGATAWFLGLVRTDTIEADYSGYNRQSVVFNDPEWEAGQWVVRSQEITFDLSNNTVATIIEAFITESDTLNPSYPDGEPTVVSTGTNSLGDHTNPLSLIFTFYVNDDTGVVTYED